MDKEYFDIIAKTSYGLEEVLAEEIQAIGGDDIQLLNRAVAFIGTKETLYRANLELRTALRVLVPIHFFEAFNETDLYREAKFYEWEKLLNPDKTFAVDSAVYSPYFNHENYVALKVKDAIVDRLREIFGKRPNIDTENPDIRINVRISDEYCTISLDSSGNSLHKRGYRIGQGIAPINEVLAAGMILLTGWRGDSDFIDPMCGSGTILMEAATIAYNIPPGIKIEEFAFMKWENYNPELWKSVRDAAISRQREFNYKIIGFDESQKAINISKDNVKNADLGWKILLKKKRIQDITSQDLSGSGVVVMNPPYGERMEEGDVLELYQEIGDSLKANFDGYDVWIISSNREAFGQIRLRTSRKIALYSGALECRFQKYQMYKGSRKSKYIKAQDDELKENIETNEEIL